MLARREALNDAEEDGRAGWRIFKASRNLP